MIYHLNIFYGIIFKSLRLIIKYKRYLIWSKLYRVFQLFFQKYNNKVCVVRSSIFLSISARMIVINYIFANECECHEGTTKDKKERRNFNKKHF